MAEGQSELSAAAVPLGSWKKPSREAPRDLRGPVEAGVQPGASELAVAGATTSQPPASPGSAGNEMVAGDTEMPLAAVDPGQARPEGECPSVVGVCTPVWGVRTPPEV